MAEKREPSNSRKQEPRKQYVLDDEAKFKRMISGLERLFMDNHCEDPDGSSSGTSRRPIRRESRITYDDDSSDDESNSEEEGKGKKKGRGRKGKKARKPKSRVITTMKFEDWIFTTPEAREVGKMNYFKAQVPPSKYPMKYYCDVCGFKANYTCVQCGTRFCSVQCSKIHKDTRCLKYVV